MRRKAFSLIELLTVVAIIAILAAILMPVFIQVKNYAQQWVAGEAMAKLGTATTLYLADNDDTYPVAYYTLPSGSRQNWFGIVGKDSKVDPDTSLLKPYVKGKIQRDYALNAQPYDGDDTGYGYNWGYLGSDFYTDLPRSNSKFCMNPAPQGLLSDTSRTIVYGTSSFFYATWLPKGDGGTYDFAFIDPPKYWFGNPTLDFRHMGKKTVDKKKHEVDSTGIAVLVFADNHVKPAKQKAVKDAQFERTPPPDPLIQP